MGCWNETCAISGLPIEEGEECYRIQFTDVNLIAFCCIDSFTGFLEAVENISLGRYDGYGGLIEDQPPIPTQDGTVYILKKFWDMASDVDEDIAKAVEKIYKEDYRRFELTDKVVAKHPDIASDWMNHGGYRLWKSDPIIYKQFLAVLYIMATLRRTFYTGAYRGAQSTTKAKQVMKAIDEAKYA
jgi:hypothetical protein